jgi:hypothetical protein
MSFRDKIASFWGRPQTRDLTKHQNDLTQTPRRRKLNGGNAGNYKLNKSIYTGSNSDFGLVSYIAHPIINIPKMLVGIPTVRLEEGEDPAGQALIDELTPLLLDEGGIIIKTMLFNGTDWRFPRWDAGAGRLALEDIQDDSIASIVIDTATGRIKQIWTDEELETREGEYNVKITNRRRLITREQITDWIGTPEEVTYANRFGIMPIPFGHDCLPNEWRGTSVYAPIAQLLKDTNDIAYNRDEILAEFTPKLSINGIKDVNIWIENQRKIGSVDKENKFDVMGSRVFLGRDGESVALIALPSDATASHTAALADNERRIMMASGMPQLFFGQLSTGTQAANDAQVRLAVEAVTDIRNETLTPWTQMVNASLDVLAFMRFTRPPKVRVEYGHFNLMSTAQRAATIASLSTAFATMQGAGGLTPEMAEKMLADMYPDLPAQNADAMIAGMQKMSESIGAGAMPEGVEPGDIGL